MGDLRLNNRSYSGQDTGVLMLNGVNYTGGVVDPKYSEVTVSGAVCSFETDNTLPLKSAVFEINGTADEINVTIQGVNFFNEDTELGRINDTTGQPTASAEVIRSKSFSPVIGGQPYFVKVGSNQNIRVYWYDSNETFISVTGDVNNVIITAPANAALMKFRSTRDYGNVYLNDISINIPSSDTDYHQYIEPETQTIDLGTTRTGGTVTVSANGSCIYDDGNGNKTVLTAINPLFQLYGKNTVFCDTGDSAVTYRVKGGTLILPSIIVPQMNSNSQDGFTARASSEFSSGYQAYMVFDGKTSSAWSPQNDAATDWVEIEMPSAKVATKISITTRSGSYYATSVTIQGSNDGVNYTTLETITGMTAGTTAVFVNSSSTAYSIYRFVVDDFGLAMINIEGVDETANDNYIKSWLLKSGSSDEIATIVSHQTFSILGDLSSFDVHSQRGGETVVSGDITTEIGSSTNWLWKATATASMTYRLYNVTTGTLGALQTANVNDVIINDGDLTTYCVEIRRYS